MRQLLGLLAGGQVEGLVALAQVDAVLDPSQQGPGPLERGRVTVGDEAERLEPADRVHRPPHPQLRVDASPDQLQPLHEELGFADPAAAELHVALGVDAQLLSGA